MGSKGVVENRWSSLERSGARGPVTSALETRRFESRNRSDFGESSTHRGNIFPRRKDIEKWRINERRRVARAPKITDPDYARNARIIERNADDGSHEACNEEERSKIRQASTRSVNLFFLRPFRRSTHSGRGKVGR